MPWYPHLLYYYWEVIASILEPSYYVLSPLNQRLDLILKSPRTTVKKGLFAVTVSMFQNHLATGLANDVKKQICIIYFQSLSQNWCTLVNNEYYLKREEISIINTNTSSFSIRWNFQKLPNYHYVAGTSKLLSSFEMLALR